MKWLTLKFCNYFGLSPNEIELRPRGLENRLAIRMGQSSDMLVFEQIFVDQELAFVGQISPSPRLIIDLGANVGYASCVFLNKFPDAFVLAVEPDPQNAAQCRKNLMHYANRSRVIEAAVWSSNGELFLSRGTFGDGREWATEVKEASSDDLPVVKSIAIPELLAFCPSDEIDLLKIDIEGSELELFSKNTQLWLRAVHNLCIENHGPKSAQVILGALAGVEYTGGRCGEYDLFLNLKHTNALKSTAWP